MTTGPDQPNYKAMAELRYQIRRFLRFSENAARQAGIEPQQHQLLLSCQRFTRRTSSQPSACWRKECSYSTTAPWNSSTDWSKGASCSDSAPQTTGDNVLVKLTRDGEGFLQKLSLHHLQELQSAGPTFVKVLQSLIEESDFR